ncbi:MAG: glycosyltransferase [Thermaurantimonas sp.]
MKFKKNRKLKVFHGLVNYGTQAGLFARELRNQGFEAISVTYPDAFKRMTDVELKHGGNLLQKVIKHTWNYLFRIKCMFKYDIFHFYYGTTLLPYQLDLPILNFYGKKIVMEYLGWDLQLYEYSVKKYKYTNAKYYKNETEAIKGDKLKIRRLNFESKFTDKQLVCAPYLSEFLPTSKVLPLGIDLEKFKFQPLKLESGYLVIIHAPTSTGNKGTPFIESAIEKLINEGEKITYKRVQNISHDKLHMEYEKCHLFIDQIISGWYGTASIEAMAIGRPTICFLREEYFQYIDYGHKIPIINANPDTIYETLKMILRNKEHLIELGAKSRKFVEEVHDVKKITSKLIKEYSSL